MPPVARAPALQWVSTVDPSRSSVSPCSPMRRHISRSSSRMSIASPRIAFQISALSASAFTSATAVTRSTAHARFAAVGRASRIRSALSASRARKSEAVPSTCRLSDATSPIAPAMPMAGAPRTRRLWIASITSSTSTRSISLYSEGSKV